jgi:hypothetical protein
MARIPDHELEHLKSTVSVQRLVEAKGVALVRHGADLHGCCPFHDDRTPSLVVSPAKNLWHCLGACQIGGSAIDWVMKAEGVSFRHAVELLRGDAPLTAGHVVKQATVRKLTAPVDVDADDAALLAQVIDYYHQTLKQSPEALAYLQQRGIASDDAIDRFQLGFANRTLGLRLPAMNRKAGAEVRTRLQRLGVLRESGHEHLNGSLVIPVHDAAGNVVEVYGRKITPGLRPGTPLHLYLPGPHRGPDVLECRLSQRDRRVWRQRLHRRTPTGIARSWHRARADRLRPRRGRRIGHCHARNIAHGRWYRLLSHPVPERHGRQRIRIEGGAGREVVGAGDPQSRMVGQWHATHGERSNSGQQGSGCVRIDVAGRSFLSRCC